MSDHRSSLLSEQVAYYRARADDYLEQAARIEGFAELEAALVAFRPTGDVLELACGPGTWTPVLLRSATTVTGVDAAPEMLEHARRRVQDDARVRFVEADLFSWRPDRQYDAVVFGFWLSHVPLDRFDEFWCLVRDALTPTGSVFFMDDANRSPDELVHGEASTTVVRRTADGSEHRLVKVAYAAKGLQQRLTDLGWGIEVHGVGDHLYWGSGGRAR